MKRMSKIISLPSVLHGTGRRLGLVERVCLSADGQDVAGLELVEVFGLAHPPCGARLRSRCARRKRSPPPSGARRKSWA